MGAGEEVGAWFFVICPLCRKYRLRRSRFEVFCKGCGYKGRVRR